MTAGQQFYRMGMIASGMIGRIIVSGHNIVTNPLFCAAAQKRGFITMLCKKTLSCLSCRLRSYPSCKIVDARSLILFLCITLFSTCHAAPTPSLISAIQDGDYKKAIKLQQDRIALAGTAEKGPLTYELAMLYLKDQDQELAFRTLLQVLDFTNTSVPEKPYDKDIYKKAFDIYLDPTSPSPQETAGRLLDLLQPYLKEHPQETLLEFYVAIAYANLGKYEDFFSHFYSAYQVYPEHYLAFRTKAVLHLKILERQRTDKERAVQREAVVANLKAALQKQPHDFTLYKMLITFSSKDNKQEIVRQCLNKILNANIIIPRGDLLFYVQAAVESREIPLANRFIQRAHEWYPQSRIVNTAQLYLEAHKGEYSHE